MILYVHVYTHTGSYLFIYTVLYIKYTAISIVSILTYVIRLLCMTLY